jgi:hypothetical protein
MIHTLKPAVVTTSNSYHSTVATAVLLPQQRQLLQCRHTTSLIMVPRNLNCPQ